MWPLIWGGGNVKVVVISSHTAIKMCRRDKNDLHDTNLQLAFYYQKRRLLSISSVPEENEKRIA